MNTETHPFQVRTWLPEDPSLKLFGCAHWSETARCQTEDRANRIAKALIFVGYGPIMAVVKLSDEKPPEYVACYPDKETVARETCEAIR
jgi:hypothetical protein